MGAVMFLTPYFFKSQVPPPVKKDAAAVVDGTAPEPFVQIAGND
jgi:hypothetical protein